MFNFSNGRRRKKVCKKFRRKKKEEKRQRQDKQEKRQGKDFASRFFPNSSFNQIIVGLICNKDILERDSITQ